VTYAILVGPGTAGGLESDAHLAVVVHNDKTGQTELMRFGGKTLAYKGTRVESAAADVLAVVTGGKLTRTVTTLP
jgi:hypothetical protein